MRVAVDASLFRVLADGDTEAAGKELDALLTSVVFRHRQKALTPGDRSRRSLRLWRTQITTCAAELAFLFAAEILRLWSI